MLKLRKNKKGFTLVELIVVIAIMAVLAGTIAGVTVSQLNKNTDKANQTQARKVADQIASLIIGNDIIVSDEGVLQFPGAGTADATAVTIAGLNTELNKEFPDLLVLKANAKKGNIYLELDNDTAPTKIKVGYKPKAGGNDTYYTVNSDGTVA